MNDKTQILIIGRDSGTLKEFTEKVIPYNDFVIVFSDSVKEYGESSSDPNPSLILTSDNFENCKIISESRKLKKYEKTPVILIRESKKAPLNYFEGYEKGPVDYIFYPFENESEQGYALEKIGFYTGKKEDDKKDFYNTSFDTPKIKESILPYKIPDSDMNGQYGGSDLFLKKGYEVFGKALSEKKDLSLITADINGLREFNRRKGYEAGKIYILGIEKILSEKFGLENTFRFYGDRFLILLPETPLESAFKKAEKIMDHLSDKCIDISGDNLKISLNFGLSSLTYDNPKNFDELLYFAEDALFSGKEKGKGILEIYSGNQSTDVGDILVLRKRIENILEKNKASAISSIEKLVKMAGGESVESHNKRVLKFIDLVCERMRLPNAITEPFKRAAVLHDCFKYLLDKSTNREKLSDEEKVAVMSYPYMLAELTEEFDFFSNERSVLLFHHENYDGSGYPEGLKGAEIPLGARIFSVADAVVAMLSDRPYRKKRSFDEVKNELRKNAGKQFDPSITEIFISLLDEKKEY